MRVRDLMVNHCVILCRRISWTKWSMSIVHHRNSRLCQPWYTVRSCLQPIVATTAAIVACDRLQQRRSHRVYYVKCHSDYSVQNDESLRGLGTVQMREESEREIKRSEKRCDLGRQQKLEREGGSSDVWWKTVPQMSDCNRKRSVTDNGQTSTSNVQRCWRDRTYSRHLATVSAGRRSSPHRYVGARLCWH